MAIILDKPELYARLGLVVILIGMAITICGQHLQVRALKAESARLEQAAEVANQRAAQSEAAHNRDKALWQATGLALTTAATLQGQITRKNLERLAEIDKIGRECVAVARPEGSVDDETSRKAINMFNNSLLAPLGGVRP